MASVITTSRKRRRSCVDPAPVAVTPNPGTTFPERRAVARRVILPPPCLPTQLIQELVQQRHQLQKEGTDELDRQIQSLQEKLVECEGKRWLRRRQLDYQTRIRDLELEKEARVSGAKLAQFDAVMKPAVGRLRRAADLMQQGKGTRVLMEDAEREVRKRLTSKSAPIALQHARVGDVCDDCGVSMRVVASDSLLACPHCAKTRIIPVIAAASAESEYVGSTAYNQKSRLLEWLEFCQAKEYAEPAPDVLDVVMDHLVSTRATGLESYAAVIAAEYQAKGPFKHAKDAIERLGSVIPNLETKLQDIRASTVRAAMQAISTSRHEERLRKFYERAPKYAAYISGYWPLRFSNTQEERIRRLYAVAAPAYDKYRKPSQPNWPGGYAYFLRCLCVLLGWDEFVHHFNITAGPKNTAEREAIRQKIWTEELDWEYVPCTPPLPTTRLVAE